MLSEIKVGEKYARKDGEKVEPICIKNGWVTFLYDDGAGDSCNVSGAIQDWSEIPPEPIKYYQVISKAKGSDTPFVWSYLYTSKEHWLIDGGGRKVESDYEWINLKEVEL
jgi:hypothetical protein